MKPGIKVRVDGGRVGTVIAIVRGRALVEWDTTLGWADRKERWIPVDALTEVS